MSKDQVASPASDIALDDFQIGDVVRMKRADADGWMQPWRKFAEAGREAVVYSRLRGDVWCEFRPKRRGAQSWKMNFRPKSLELVSRAKPEDGENSRDANEINPPLQPIPDAER